jgi:hypothetical protein
LRGIHIKGLEIVHLVEDACLDNFGIPLILQLYVFIEDISPPFQIFIFPVDHSG